MHGYLTRKLVSIIITRTNIFKNFSVRYGHIAICLLIFFNEASYFLLIVQTDRKWMYCSSIC